VVEGVVDDISHEGLRVLLRDEGVSFQRIKTWKTSKDPDYEAKKARVEHLYAIADGEVVPEPGEPEVIWCLDEFGPLNRMPHPGRHWAAISGKNADPDRDPRPKRRATYNRNDGVRHLFAAYNLMDDKLFGHVKPRKKRVQFLEFCRYLRTLHPPATRIAIICDNFSPHLTTRVDTRVGDWAAANNVEIAYTGDQQFVAESHRGPVHCAALLRSGWDGPSQPQGAGQHDPPLHHLAQQPRHRPVPTQGRRPRERCLNPATHR
jgi:hypothetical protein